MAKMFVNYSKTKAEFISAGLPTTYTNSIVFIKGDASGNGSCIYTHGMYFANFAEFLAAINYVKGISVGGQSYNAAAGGGYVAFSATDPSTVAVNAGSNGIEIGLTEAFVNKVNNTASDLGSKDDAASSTGSAFARIANLAQLVSDLTGGSTESVAGQITSAINALRTEIVGTLDSGDSQTLQTINDELDALQLSVSNIIGKSTDAASANTIYGAKAYADEKALGIYDTLEPRVIANESAVKTNSDAIATLNGNETVNGSVDKKIKDAINDFATKVSEDQTVNTFKELIDYAATHGEEFSELVGVVDANTKSIETLNGDASTAGSVDKKVADAVAAEAAIARAAEEANAEAIAAITDAPSDDFKTIYGGYMYAKAEWEAYAQNTAETVVSPVVEDVQEINNYTVNGHKISENPVLSGDDLKAGNVPAVKTVIGTAAIADTDMVPAAFAKLENRLDLLEWEEL